jgi:hypothetical protein
MGLLISAIIAYSVDFDISGERVDAVIAYLLDFPNFAGRD